MEVAVPVMAPSAPCSPRTAAAMGGGGSHLPSYCYFFSSAPTSPSRASSYAADEQGDAATFDFAFGFSGQLRESTPILAAADELFEGGRIRPLNGPRSSGSGLLADEDYASLSVSPRSPRRARTMSAVRGGAGDRAEVSADQGQTRGRSGRPAPASSSSSGVSSRSRRATRSLSPYRGDPIDDEFCSSPPSPRGAASLMRGCGSGSRKWRLKDLFLFRSASEGRATAGKDPLLKYSMLKSGGDASMRKGRGSAASASDMAPYTVSRAAAEEMRRRTTTPLPFHRNSLFGYFRSNPAIHSISRKLSSYSSSNSNRGRSATAAAN
ncbi:hypothetical protein CFC21_022451 [Triticum aestivum]|uniref:Uncharacterized protein n=3 Tax=Triticum TaxID=4564 RepID=A0A9R1RJJ1_TRITD|nr:uncharacterized protein LOC119362956 [Triticum dicoccoides]XP_044322779.1 uncharacterized protein LOC123044184 [Triticum aestivum]KAF7007520.1 hypothetical protein CFC21_022451 [Triticum aestivum]VAH43729.1 unnamed protein product [Triticum turgidum subsp. durum]